MAVLVSKGGCSEIPQTEWLQQQKLIFPNFWRTDVQNQWIRDTGTDPSLLPWFSDDFLLPMALHHILSLGVWVQILSLGRTSAVMV